MECVTIKMLMDLGFENMLPVLGVLHTRYEFQSFQDCDVEKYRKLYMMLQEQKAIKSKFSICVTTNLSDYLPFNKLGLVDMNFAIYDKEESNFHGTIANYPSFYQNFWGWKSYREANMCPLLKNFKQICSGNLQSFAK